MQCNYEELKNAALAPDATQDDINALGEWFERYGDRYWNGEYFDVNGEHLYRIYSYDEECDQYDVVGYEFN